MPSEIIITLVVIIAAVILLATNRIRPDVVALMVLVTLGLSGVVASQKVFSGFSSSAVMTILAISMISIGLQQTGATNALGKIIYRIGGHNETLLIFLVTLFSAVVSLFMNNIAAVGVLLPAVMTLSRRSRVSSSRLLMPLAFGTILGGMATLLTTSNIIVSGALKDAGYSSFGLLDYFPVGGPVVIVGIIYLITLGKKLLPKSQKREGELTQYEFTDRLIDLYQIKKDLLRITLLPSCSLAGTSIQDGNWSNNLNLNILAVLRKKVTLFSPEPETFLFTGDILIAQGEIDASLADSLKLKVEPVTTNDFQVSDPPAETGFTSLLKLTGSIPPKAVSAILVTASMLLTLIMSGQVSAIIMIPLALSAAQSLGIDPRPLSMAVAMGCSLAFISPLGHPVNIMVMNPGGYTFKDYFRVGLPLTLLAFITILLGIHLFWGL